MFEYDEEAPPDVRDIAVEDRGGVKVHDISYAGRKGSRVSSYLVVPPGGGPFAGVVFQHGGAQDRSAFLSEALKLARAGAVSLLVDAPFVREGLNFDAPEVDYESFVGAVVNLRRGVDLLTARGDVDARRLGYVGLSFGGQVGSILASVERRVTAYVLLGLAPSMSEIWRTSELPFAVEMRSTVPEEQAHRYVETLAPLDSINYIGRAAPSALFLQFARHDEVTSERDAWRCYHAASEPKDARWYDSGHMLLGSNPEGRRDRAEWLGSRLDLRPVEP